MKGLSFLFLAGLIICTAARPLSPESYQILPTSLPGHYGVIGVQVQTAAPDTIEIRKVNLHSPAARAGLQIGDRIIAALPYRVRTPEEFSRFIQSLEPSSTVALKIERQGKLLEVSCAVTDIRELYFLMGEQGIVPRAVQPRHARWNARMDLLEKEARTLISQQNADSALDDLAAALAIECHRYAGDCRLQDVHYALQHPLKGALIASELAGEFQHSGSLQDHLLICSAHLDLVPVASPAPPAKLLDILDKDGDFPPIARYLLLPFFTAILQVDEAFAAFDSDERQALFSGIPALLDQLGESLYLDAGDSTQTANHIRTIRQAKKIDLSRLFTAAGELAALTTPAALKKIRQLAKKQDETTQNIPLPPAFRGTFLYARHTAWGWVLIGDKGPNFYGENAALIVDIGGDDTYLNNCGAPIFTPQDQQWRQVSSVGLVIDYKGNDRYIGNSLGAVGAAVGGIGLLVDLEGDDLYQGTRLTQGASFGGIGILWDRRGKDTYLAQEAAQGASFFGAGLLLDHSGTDFYSSTLFSQAFGGTRGFGLLWDQQGDDTYLADRKVASSYGNRGVYEGFSQGVGCGFRGYSSGGIGLLLDGAGDDAYQAGNFSQGTGYFFAMGLLVDQQGDDTYLGSRYTQGSSAHQAVGIVVDQSGNDCYQSKIAASQGGAWDAAIGILEDRSGDDRYAAQHLSQGAAAMNGLGLLFDWIGQDHYQVQSGQGQGGSTVYWGGRGALNLGILMDTADNDAYSRSDRRNAHTTRSPGIGLFLDR